MINQSFDSTEPLNSRPPDLLLLNAKVLTMSLRQPSAEAVAIQGQRILAVGSRYDLAGLAGPKTRIINCQGMSLLPGFIDAHCHILAMASALQSVDCSPEAVTGILVLQQAVSKRAAEIQQGGWVRGFGYDDLALNEKRHPTRWDLDQAAPDHPVRIAHRSGHATVMNSLGLARAGIDRDTPDPLAGVIQREDATGEPTGLLLEMGDFLSHRLGSLRTEDDQDEGVRRLCRTLLSYGITSVQDAGPQNNLDRWTAFQKLKTSGLFAPRVTMMAGASHVKSFSDQGLTWGSGNRWLRMGHVKIMLTLTTGQLHPDVDSLNKLIIEARQSGFPVAIHAVEAEAVAAAARAITEIPSIPSHERSNDTGANAATGEGVRRDRIEHCSECPPDVAAMVRNSGAMVVTQPGFVYRNGDNYLERVEPSMLKWLYPLCLLSRSGVSVAFGSDAPVIDPNPWPGIYSAVTGLTRTARSLRADNNNGPASSESVSLGQALRMFTLASAMAEGTQRTKGSIEPGKLADLTLLDTDVASLEPSALLKVRPVMTIIEGRLVWEA